MEPQAAENIDDFTSEYCKKSSGSRTSNFGVLMQKVCVKCHSTFLTDKSYATLCRKCFSATMEKRPCLYCDSEFWREKTRPTTWPCKNCRDEVLHHALLRPKPDPTPAKLPADFLRDLIFLVHPDKHANSEKATKATQRLLELREQTGAA